MKALFFTFLKNKLLKNEKEDFKEVLLKRMLEDSKSLGVSLYALNLAAIFFVISLCVGLVGLLNSLNLKIEQILLYSSAILAIFSIVIIWASFISLKNKVEVYKNISTIKENTTNLFWLDSFFMQLKEEHEKMKGILPQKKIEF